MSRELVAVLGRVLKASIRTRAQQVQVPLPAARARLLQLLGDEHMLAIGADGDHAIDGHAAAQFLDQLLDEFGLSILLDGCLMALP